MTDQKAPVLRPLSEWLRESRLSYPPIYRAVTTLLPASTPIDHWLERRHMDGQGMLKRVEVWALSPGYVMHLCVDHEALPDAAWQPFAVEIRTFPLDEVVSFQARVAFEYDGGRAETRNAQWHWSLRFSDRSGLGNLDIPHTGPETFAFIQGLRLAIKLPSE